MNTHPMSDPRVIGHRGASGSAPENTLPAISRAADMGVAMVEFDVKLTRCGTPVLMHDDLVDRTSDGHGPAAGFDLAALQALDAGRWFDDRFAGTRVPTLAQTIDLLVARDLDANVEIKPCPGRTAETARQVVEMLMRLWPADKRPPLLSSFEIEALATARDLAPDLPRALLFETLPSAAEMDRLTADLAPVAVHLWERPIDADVVAAVHGRGLALRAWTVNDPTRAVHLVRLGVDAVFSDFPDRILDALA